MEKETGKRVFRAVLLFIAALAVGMASYQSVQLNIIFGGSFGTTPENKALLGIVSGALDIFKAFLPIIAGIMIANKYRAAWATAWVMYVVLAGLSIAATFGFVIKNRVDTGAVRTKTVQQYERLMADLKAKRKMLAQIATLGTERALQAKIRAAELQIPKAGCTRKTRRYRSCRKLLRLQEKLALVQDREAVEREVRALERRVEQAQVLGGNDPQINAFQKLSGLSQFYVLVAIGAVFAFGLEFATGWGPVMVFNALLVGVMRRQVDEVEVLADGGRRGDGEAQAAPGETGFVEGLLRNAARHQIAARRRPRAVGRPVSDEVRGDDVRRFISARLACGAEGEMTGSAVFDEWADWCADAGVNRGIYQKFIEVFSAEITRRCGEGVVFQAVSGRRFADHYRFAVQLRQMEAV